MTSRVNQLILVKDLGRSFGRRVIRYTVYTKDTFRGVEGFGIKIKLDYTMSTNADGA